MNAILQFLLLFVIMFNFASAQQICLQAECGAQLKACDQACQNKLTTCTFKCTLGS